MCVWSGLVMTGWGIWAGACWCWSGLCMTGWGMWAGAYSGWSVLGIGTGAGNLGGGYSGAGVAVEAARPGCLGMGWNFLRCFLFLNVVLPVPSTFTRYWSYPLHSTTLPVCSHHLGWLPTRFYRNMSLPCTSWARSLVWAFHFSQPAMCLLAIA